MVASVLAILAALSTGFYTMMVMQLRSAVRYSDSVRAELLAKGGVDYALAGLRYQAYKNIESPNDAWYMVDYLNGAHRNISFPDNPILHNGKDNDGDGTANNFDEVLSAPAQGQNLPWSRVLGNTAGTDSDRINLNIFDAASRININQCDNLAVVLDN